MKNLTIIQIIRLAGMSTWLLYPVGILFAFANRQGPYMALSAHDWLLLFSLTVFGACFWVSMKDVRLGHLDERLLCRLQGGLLQGEFADGFVVVGVLYLATIGVAIISPLPNLPASNPQYEKTHPCYA